MGRATIKEPRAIFIICVVVLSIIALVMGLLGYSSALIVVGVLGSCASSVALVLIVLPGRNHQESPYISNPIDDNHIAGIVEPIDNPIVPTVRTGSNESVVLSLRNQLRTANATMYGQSRAKALRAVVENAVAAREYVMAIEAAESSPYGADQAHNLSYVAKKAIDDKMYDIAEKAASKIPYGSQRDEMIIEAIKARKIT